MKKAFLLLLLAASASATALAQPKPKKRVVPPPPPIAPHKDLKISETASGEHDLHPESLTFEWLNNAKDTVVLPGQLLISKLNLNDLNGLPKATLKTVEVADTVRIRKGQEGLHYVGIYTHYNVKREQDVFTLTQPNTGETLRFRLLRKGKSARISGLEHLDSRRIYKSMPSEGPSPSISR